MMRGRRGGGRGAVMRGNGVPAPGQKSGGGEVQITQSWTGGLKRESTGQKERGKAALVSRSQASGKHKC